jgi:hypothetical protein
MKQHLNRIETLKQVTYTMLATSLLYAVVACISLSQVTVFNSLMH